MLRVIAGEFKNRTVSVPRSKSANVVTEMIREALFNILGDMVIGARFADLFAGSGVVGIEALSRGASRVTFIDNEKKNIQLIEKNIASLNIGKDRARVWHNDVFKVSQNESEWAEWDIIFLDPPWLIKDNFMDSLVRSGTVIPGTLTILKRPSERTEKIASEYMSLLDQRDYRYGTFYFFR
ncbi:MAG: RsmD family RNA methyltransferase [bacterium]|jgi:16S rRNA (guanine966-N2)-methyltransferase